MTSASYTIRRLGPADVELLRQLNLLFGRVFAEPDTYGADPPDDSYLREFLAKEQVLVLVALVEEVIVGGLVAYELQKFEKARSEIYIYDLAVEADHRRRGIATALIQQVQNIAAERGAWIVFVQADRDDDRAIALYEKLGTREDVVHFDITVNRA